MKATAIRPVMAQAAIRPLDREVAR